jgi:hypothetical protein
MRRLVGTVLQSSAIDASAGCLIKMNYKYSDPRPTCVMDTECFQNYWAAAFKSIADGRTRLFEMYDGHPLDRPGIATITRNWRVVTFNGINYDMPMLALAMSGASCATLKRCSDDIIVGQMKPWEIEEKYNLTLPHFIDHIDVMEVSPGSPTKPSLKIYAGRLHSKRMQDLPIEPDQWLTDEDMAVLRDYHVNDLDVTIDLAKELEPQILLRAEMSDQYGVDLRSKSDAQVAEAVVKAEIQRITGEKIWRPDIKPGLFRYKVPKWVRFETEPMQPMQQMLQRLIVADFRVKHDGYVEMPAMLADATIDIGAGRYQMGIGGLHSNESSTSHYSNDAFVLLDRDVTSYYPSLILNNRLIPPHIGAVFLDVYRKIFERRLAAKKAGQKNIAETLKIALNGTFGKTGSPYSAIYAPEQMIQTTVTGQLALLMLIESVEKRGMRVVSANTDGFVTMVPRARRAEFEAIITEWEWATSFGTEETEYLSLHLRDVNGYIAIGRDGKVKTKGPYTTAGPGQPGASGMKKNPDGEITVDAVVAFLKDGIPLEQTIRACTDIRKFVSIRKVKGGAEKDGVYIGKAIRWYYAVGETGTINYRDSGNKVPDTDGARPCMELPDSFPDDVDHAYYIRQAHATLQDLGVETGDPALTGRRGLIYARMFETKTVHLLDLAKQEALCGKAPVSIRERWVEYGCKPDGERICGACRRANEL